MTSHAGIGITKNDYAAFNRDLAATLDKFKVPEPERSQVMGFIASWSHKLRRKKGEWAGMCPRPLHSRVSRLRGLILRRNGLAVELSDKVLYLALQLRSRTRSVRRISSCITRLLPQGQARRENSGWDTWRDSTAQPFHGPLCNDCLARTGRFGSAEQRWLLQQIVRKGARATASKAGGGPATRSSCVTPTCRV
jgi:hypothetical protein